MRILVVGLVVVGLAGCSVATQRVEVPVPIYCDPPAVLEPVRPVDALPMTSDVFTVTRALWATVEVLEGYAGELRAAVEACRGP